jgi:hypothetical protein
VGYFGRKVLVFNGLQRGSVCKIFNTNELCAKYLLSISYAVVALCYFSFSLSSIEAGT